MNNPDTKFSKLQVEVLSKSSTPYETLKAFIRNSNGKILTIQNDRLLIVPVYYSPLPKCSWSANTLFLEIKTIFASSEIAIQVFEYRASDYVLEHVVNWLLLCPSQERLLAGGAR